VKDGPRKGLRTLAEAEDLARELFQSLDESQKKVAYQEKPFPEIQEGTPAPKVGEPKGLAASKMNDKQRTGLMRLLEAYANRMPPDIAEMELSGVKKAGPENVHFA